MPFLTYLPTVLIIAALVGILALAIRSIIRDRRKGGSCGCGCSSCPRSGACHPDSSTEQSK